MIRDPLLVAEFEREYSARAAARSSYSEALAIFCALWNQAKALNPDFPSDWRSDLDADFAVARAVNGLPPA